MSRQPIGTHSFVVKIWTENDSEVPPDAPDSSSRDSLLWRGSVTHVDSRKRVYFQRLPHLVSILAPYVLDLDGELDGATRYVAWSLSRSLPERATEPPANGLDPPPDQDPSGHGSPFGSDSDDSDD